MTAEQWWPIPGFEGLYEVSDRGRVRSLPRTIWRACRSQGCGRPHPWRYRGRILVQSRTGSTTLSRHGHKTTFKPIESDR